MLGLCALEYLLFNDVGGLIVEDGSKAMGVCCCFWIQTVVEGHIDGGEFIPELLLTLKSDKHFQ